jgi:D-alanine-D-alanine ligase
MINVAIIAGGDSGENVISIKSGKQVELYIDRDLFNPFLISMKGDKWVYRAGFKKFTVDKNDFTITIGKRKIRFDIVFNAIHGTPGENGKLQGYFDIMKIPYTSCDVTTSALSFNKNLCKKVVSSIGIKTPESVHLFRDAEVHPVEKLKMPLFIKPNNGGSSVGISKIHRKDQIGAALEKAFAVDDEVLVEECIRGRELTCGVIRSASRIIAFPITEIIPKNEFFDYEAKYTKGKSSEVVPAEIPEEVSNRCKEISVFLFEKLNCKGVVRFDYIFDGNNFFFLEVNTVPGLTAASIVPKMALAYGWSFRELITRLILEELKTTS